ncbi:hypothetical protein [Romboutsia sp.]|uniref:hypothetical protein n=1 Tax=Romboutsia sp. TaxID=1965302 RepID=UPI003F302D7E
MFEKKDPFSWKVPVLILTGIVVLSSGIYIGIKTRDIGKEKEVAKVHQVTKNNEKEKVKESFQLNKNCEIWLDKKNTDGSDTKEAPAMLGTVPKELLDKSKEEIVAYLNNKYPDRKIESMTQYEIVLSETEVPKDPSRKSKYSLEVDSNFIAIFRYDINGKRELVEKTQIKIDSLPQIAQEEIQKGILVNTKDEAYAKIEDFGS